MKQVKPFWAFVGLLLFLVGVANLVLADSGWGIIPLITGIVLLLVTIASGSIPLDG